MRKFMYKGENKYGSGYVVILIFSFLIGVGFYTKLPGIYFLLIIPLLVYINYLFLATQALDYIVKEEEIFIKYIFRLFDREERINIKDIIKVLYVDGRLGGVYSPASILHVFIKNKRIKKISLHLYDGKRRDLIMLLDFFLGKKVEIELKTSEFRINKSSNKVVRN